MQMQWQSDTSQDLTVLGWWVRRETGAHKLVVGVCSSTTAVMSGLIRAQFLKPFFFFNPASSFPEIYLIVIFTPQWNDTDKNIFCNRERLETTEMSISRWLVKWITVCPHNGIRGDHQKKNGTATRKAHQGVLYCQVQKYRA